MKTATDCPQTRENSGLRHLDGQEVNRERREKNGNVEAEGRRFGKGAVKRQAPGTAPTLAFRPEKNPTDKGWVFGKWWSWGDLNPRPQAFFAQFYMCSRLFWISPSAPRSDTLRRQPVPLDLASRQGTRRETSRYEFPCSLDGLAATLAQPIGVLLQGSPD